MGFTKRTSLPNKEIQKTKFLELCYTYIKRDGLDSVLKYLDSTDFFSAPASTKFHCDYVGGLVEHSINVFETAISLNKTFGDGSCSDESIAVAALFHDICKANFYKRDSRNVKNEQGQWVAKQIWSIDDALPLGHGEKSCMLLLTHMKLTRDEMIAIRWHMAGYDCAVKGGEWGNAKAMNMTQLCSLLQCADMVATGLLEISKEQMEGA